jgi:hypothetical protein
VPSTISFLDTPSPPLSLGTNSSKRLMEFHVRNSQISL